MKHENSVSFASSMPFMRRESYWERLSEVNVRPVVRMSISINPVSGSTADFNVALLINSIAPSTSCAVTSLLSLILAKA